MPGSGALDALAFSGTWVALAAAALTAASSRAMGVPVDPAAVGLAFCGTLVIYAVDRLRDVDVDRGTSPLRSAFVRTHGGDLALLTAGAAIAALAFAVAAGPRAGWVLAPVLGLGLLHRRLKHFTFGKSAYITAAWVGVVVGLPAVLATGAARVGFTGLVVGCAVYANAVASSVRDAEVAAARFGARPVLAVARATAAAGLVAALLGPAEARALAAVPAAIGIALLFFRPTERYGLLVVDGALLAGGLVATALAGG